MKVSTNENALSSFPVSFLSSYVDLFLQEKQYEKLSCYSLLIVYVILYHCMKHMCLPLHMQVKPCKALLVSVHFLLGCGKK